MPSSSHIRPSDHRSSPDAEIGSPSIWSSNLDPPSDQAFLAAIVETSDDAILSKDRHGLITSWNKAAERVFGYTREEAVGRPIYLLIPPERADEEEGIMARLLRGERIEHFETVRMRKGGERFDASLTISPLRDQTGKLLGASKIVRDISERKRIEGELRRRTAELTAFVETAHIGLHWVGPDGTILWANAAEMEMLGYSPVEYIGHNIAEFHAEKPVIEDILSTLSRGERLREYEAKMRCKDGSIRHVIVDSSVLWEDGRFVHTQCFTRDITEHKRAAEELRRVEAARRESEERFRAIADNISQLTWMADEQGNIVWYNQRWFDYTGTTLEEVQGWGWQKVHHPDHVDRVAEKIRRHFASGEIWEDTFPLRGKDGQYRWFLSRAVPIRDATGRVLRWFGTNTDITELRETQHALERARTELANRTADLETAVAKRTAELTASIAELESVSYSLSHDMRAPLRTIHGFCQIVLEEAGAKLEPAEAELLKKCIRAAARLDRLIQDVLTYSQVAKTAIELVTVDVDRLLREVIDERPEFQPPHAEIEIRRPLQAVCGHEVYLTQCITNLLDNAVKFVAPGGVPRVTIWDERVGDEVRLWFEDNGIGIPEHVRHRLFGIFQRLHSDPRFPGTGIGLAIVRKAVERMHGSVGVESTPGQGSRFWLRLPAAKTLP